VNPRLALLADVRQQSALDAVNGKLLRVQMLPILDVPRWSTLLEDPVDAMRQHKPVVRDVPGEVQLVFNILCSPE